MTEHPISLAAIRAREADPLTKLVAQQRADRMTDRLLPHEARLDVLAAQAQRAASDRAKVALLREAADLIGAAAAGNVACKKGCSACCHIAVLMSPQEAAVIGREIGVKPATPAQGWRPGRKDAEVDRHYGVRCPFLQAGACGIYAQRPLACRTQFNMDVDALLCTVVPGESITVPYWNHMPFTQQISNAFASSMFGFADIREFFPKGKGK